jgi:hypothetical protein
MQPVGEREREHRGRLTIWSGRPPLPNPDAYNQVQLTSSQLIWSPLVSEGGAPMHVVLKVSEIIPCRCTVLL